MTQDEIKLIKKKTHCYSQSEYTLSRPLTMQDALPKMMLDSNKSYQLVNGQTVEINNENNN